MADLLIKDAELKRLDQLIGIVPTQYGLPIVNFFQQVANLRQQEAQAEANKQTEALKTSEAQEGKKKVK